MIRLLLCVLAATTFLSAQTNPRAYELFNDKGRKTTFNRMLRELAQADVILFGEYHDNPIAHWMELEIAKRLGTYDLGLEMFETDEQDALDLFMIGELTVSQLDSVTGGVWPNFSTDYLPLLEQARETGARVYATNIPRRYARMVFQRGLVVLRSLPQEETVYLPPLPVPYDPELPAYRAMLMQDHASGHGGERFPQAQAVKDATMAWFIARQVDAGGGRPFLHVNGSYHSDDYEGINWYLRQYKPQLKVVTITTLEQPQVDYLEEESRGKADYTLLVPENMTKTY